MAPIRRVVLDVLKPHEPALSDVAERIASVEGVDGTSLDLIEMDQKVTNIRVTVEGSAIDLDSLYEAIEAQGGSVHSVDQVAAGDRLVEPRSTPQD